MLAQRSSTDLEVADQAAQARKSIGLTGQCAAVDEITGILLPGPPARQPTSAMMDSMKRPGPATGAAVLIVLAASGCAADRAVPSRAPDVTGVVAASGPQDGATLAEASDGYYEGMSLLQGDPVLVRGANGERIDPAELEPGDDVEVWVGGACAESFPVQCDIEAVRVLP